MFDWQIATLLESKASIETIKLFKFKLNDPEPFLPGQHFDFRLTSPNGHQAQRSYSIASAPEQKDSIEFGIMRLENGEVSPFLFDMKVGDQVEVRGPIGKYFVWDINVPGPLIVIGGGVGFVPLMSMIRHYAANSVKKDVCVVYSAKSLQEMVYYNELIEISKVHPEVKLNLALTREIPNVWQGIKGRIDESTLSSIVAGNISEQPRIYICGPVIFGQAMSDILVKIGFDSLAIRSEMFG